MGARTSRPHLSAQRERGCDIGGEVKPLLAILAVGRTISRVLSLLLRHVLTGFGRAIPARTWTVIDVGRSVDPNSHIWIARVLCAG